MYNTAILKPDASQEDVLVSEHLKEEGGERTPSRLMSSVSSLVSAGELLLVCSQLFRVHQPLVALHPRYVDLLHVSFAAPG